MPDAAALKAGGRSPGFSAQADRARSARQHWAAPHSRHDKLVGLLRWALPTAIGVMLAFLALTPFTKNGEVSFVLDKNKVDVASERMKVSSAVYRGEDSKGRPFALSANSAIQQSSKVPVVKINGMAAEIALQEGPAVLKANQGRYDLANEKVAVDGPVQFTAADGYRMQTSNVDIDLAGRTMRSRGAVSGKLPIGTFSADHLRADLGQRTLTLEGRARLHINQNALNRR